MKSKFLKIFTYILFAITVVITILFLIGNKGDDTYVSTVLGWAYILLALAIVLAIFLFITALRKGGNVKKMLGVMVAFVVVLLIAYILAPGSEVALSPSIKELPSHGVLKMVDTSLIFAIILLVVAVLVAIGGGLFKRIKN